MGSKYTASLLLSRVLIAVSVIVGIMLVLSILYYDDPGRTWVGSPDVWRTILLVAQVRTAEVEELPLMDMCMYGTRLRQVTTHLGPLTEITPGRLQYNGQHR